MCDEITEPQSQCEFNSKLNISKASLHEVYQNKINM